MVDFDYNSSCSFDFILQNFVEDYQTIIYNRFCKHIFGDDLIICIFDDFINFLNAEIEKKKNELSFFNKLKKIIF